MESEHQSDDIVWTLATAGIIVAAFVLALDAIVYAMSIVAPAATVYIPIISSPPSTPSGHSDPNWWYTYMAVGYVVAMIAWSIIKRLI